MRREVWCDRCDGCGWYEGGKALRTTCGTCGGSGVVLAPVRKHTAADRRAHDRECDRLIAIAVQRLRARREADRPLREYAEAAVVEAAQRVASEFVVGPVVGRVDGWTDAGLAKNGEHRG